MSSNFYSGDYRRVSSSDAASTSNHPYGVTPPPRISPVSRPSPHRYYDEGSSRSGFDTVPQSHQSYSRPSVGSSPQNMDPREPPPRRSCATYQPISFHTSEPAPLTSPLGHRRSSGGGSGYVGHDDRSCDYVSPPPAYPQPASILSPAVDGADAYRQRRSTAGEGSSQATPTSHHGAFPQQRSHSSGRPSVTVVAPSRGPPPGHPDGSGSGHEDDDFAISGNHWTQFTPPSSNRDLTDERTDDYYYRQRSDQRSKYQPPPPLTPQRLTRDLSGSARGLASPGQSQHQLGSSSKSGQSGRSNREIISPRLDGPRGVSGGATDLSAQSGQSGGHPQRSPTAYRKTASFGSSEDRWGSPHSRSKSLSEAASDRGMGRGPDVRSAGRRGDDGSSLETSGRRSSFLASLSLPPRESSGGLPGGRVHEAESARTLNSRLSSPSYSRIYGSPVSASVTDRSLTRPTGGARTPRFGESGGTTPRALSFQRGRVVGSGGFGTVYQAILSDGTLAAVKEMKLEMSNLKAIDREVHAMSSLPPHQNCVRYFGSRHSKHHYHIIMEYISGGSIYSLRQTVGRFRESVFQRYAYMVLLGLEHLHENGIIHRDIKGPNVLLDERGCAKIVDFGCCKDLNQGTQTIGSGGTPLWMSPEVCRGDTATVKSDVWSFGCLCLEMTNDSGLPWSFPSTMTLQGVAYALASAQNPPPIPTTLSAIAQDLVACCLRLDPAERLDVPQLLDHPFFDLDYMQDDDSEDELIVSREPSARESAVKRMVKNGNDNVEAVLVTPSNRAQDDAPPNLRDARIDPRGAATAVRNSQRPAGMPTGSVAGIAFHTGGAGSPTLSTASTGQSAGAFVSHQTVNVGFHLDAIDDSDSKDDEDDTNVLGTRAGGGGGGSGGGTAGQLLQQPSCAGSSPVGLEGASFIDDTEYMDTVNDIITHARQGSHGAAPAPRSSTATGGQHTTASNTTTTSPSRPNQGHIDLSSSTSSSFFSDGSTASASSSGGSSSASSGPRLAGRRRGGRLASNDGDLGPPALGATKGPSSRTAGGRQYQRGRSPEPESISPREPEGGTKPHPSRVAGGNSDCNRHRPNNNSSAVPRGSNSAGPGSAASATFNRRATIPLGSSGTPSPTPTPTAGCSSRRPSATAAGTPSHGVAPTPGGPSRVRQTDPPPQYYASSDGVSKARSSANANRPQGGGPATTSSSGVSRMNPNPVRSSPHHHDLVPSRGDAVFSFSNGGQSQGAPPPAHRHRTSAKSGGQANAGLETVWETSGRASISKESSSTLKDVTEMVDYSRSGNHREPDGAHGGEKKKNGLSRFFTGK